MDAQQLDAHAMLGNASGLRAFHAPDAVAVLLERHVVIFAAGAQAILPRAQDVVLGLAAACPLDYSLLCVVQ